MSSVSVQPDRHPSVAAKARWLDCDHLPADQRQVATEVARLAQKVIQMLGDSDQLVLGLQHLIDAKDCFVRASILDGERS